VLGQQHCRPTVLRLSQQRITALAVLFRDDAHDSAFGLLARLW
jgi:hypothetical protein